MDKEPQPATREEQLDLFGDMLDEAIIVETAEQARPLAERVRALSAEIARHDRLYYDEARQDISDYEYDMLVQKLRKVAGELSKIDSTHEALDKLPYLHVGGSKPAENSICHPARMFSLDNTYKEEELRDFDRRVREGLPDRPECVEYVAELKIDGAAIALMYENGKLSYAATRGDGEVGELITDNMRRSREVPGELTGPFTGAQRLEVRGEVYYTVEDFEKINERLALEDKGSAANPRNLVAGTIGRKDALLAATRRLHLFCYAVGVAEGVDLPETHADLLATLAQSGFCVNPHRCVCAGMDEVLKFVREWDVKRHNLPYPTDGLVVKVNHRDCWSVLGTTAKAPRYMIAYKFGAQQATTRLLQVEWQVGRTGVLTPVARMDEVTLAGTNVSNATLHNFDEITRLGVKIGDMVMIEKAGEIIPKVLSVDCNARTGDEREISAPEMCPECDSLLEKLTTASAKGGLSVGFYCMNAACPGRVRESLLHFTSRKAMDIQGLGEVQIRAGVDQGKLMCPADLYECTAEDWGAILGHDAWEDKKSVSNLLDSIEESKTRPLHRLLFALGIRYVGEISGRLLAQRFRTIDDLAAASADELQTIDGMGTLTASAPVEFFADADNRRLIERLKAAGVTMPNPLWHDSAGASNGGEQPVRGKSFVLTGTMSTMSRTVATERIVGLGGIVSGSVGAKTAALIVGGTDALGTSKYKKAQQLGVRILTETEFVEMLAQADAAEGTNLF